VQKTLTTQSIHVCVIAVAAVCELESHFSLTDVINQVLHRARVGLSHEVRDATTEDRSQTLPQTDFKRKDPDFLLIRL
jgi:hypothetical protein